MCIYTHIYMCIHRACKQTAVRSSQILISKKLGISRAPSLTGYFESLMQNVPRMLTNNFLPPRDLRDLVQIELELKS